MRVIPSEETSHNSYSHSGVLFSSLSSKIMHVSSFRLGCQGLTTPYGIFGVFRNQGLLLKA